MAEETLRPQAAVGPAGAGVCSEQVGLSEAEGAGPGAGAKPAGSGGRPGAWGLSGGSVCHLCGLGPRPDAASGVGWG